MNTEKGTNSAMKKTNLKNGVWYATQNIKNEWIIRQTQSGKQKTIGISSSPRRRGTRNCYVVACEMAASRNASNGLPRASSHFYPDHKNANAFFNSDLEAELWRRDIEAEEAKKKRDLIDATAEQERRNLAQRIARETTERRYIENAAKRSVAIAIIQATIQGYAGSTELTVGQARHELLEALTRNIV